MTRRQKQGMRNIRQRRGEVKCKGARRFCCVRLHCDTLVVLVYRCGSIVESHCYWSLLLPRLLLSTNRENISESSLRILFPFHTQSMNRELSSIYQAPSSPLWPAYTSHRYRSSTKAHIPNVQSPKPNIMPIRTKIFIPFRNERVCVWASYQDKAKLM